MSENQNGMEPQNGYSKSTGKTMAVIAWVIGLALLTQFFGAWEDRQVNPNRDIASLQQDGRLEVTLDSNRKGHYRFIGRINQSEADFLVDTGATEVVIPASLAKFYGLESIGQGRALTANGYVDLEKTIIDTLSIDGIKLYNVRASLNPAMSRDQPILLGMSALGQLDIEQTQGKMILRQY